MFGKMMFSRLGLYQLRVVAVASVDDGVAGAGGRGVGQQGGDADAQQQGGGDACGQVVQAVQAGGFADACRMRGRGGLLFLRFPEGFGFLVDTGKERAIHLQVFGHLVRGKEAAQGTFLLAGSLSVKIFFKQFFCLHDCFLLLRSCMVCR